MTRPLPDYLPDDQHDHLGDQPWGGQELVDWINAHGHDPRTKCLVEYGCMALANHYEWLLDEVDRLRATRSRLNDNDRLEEIRRRLDQGDEYGWLAKGDIAGLLDEVDRRGDEIERVRQAWVDPGPLPAHHHTWQHRLRDDWPALARALDELAGR